MLSSESQFKFHIGLVSFGFIDNVGAGAWGCSAVLPDCAGFTALLGYILRTFRQCCQIGHFYHPIGLLLITHRLRYSLKENTITTITTTTISTTNSATTTTSAITTTTTSSTTTTTSATTTTTSSTTTTSATTTTTTQLLLLLLQLLLLKTQAGGNENFLKENCGIL